MKLARESWIILAIGMADLILTVLLIKMGLAEEANPVFAAILRQGLWLFIVLKTVFLLGPIGIFEYARKHEPRFALIGMRFVIVAYLVLYALGFAAINGLVPFYF